MTTECKNLALARLRARPMRRHFIGHITTHMTHKLYAIRLHRVFGPYRKLLIYNDISKAGTILLCYIYERVRFLTLLKGPTT